MDFKNRVKKGRGITSDAVMESIAGGRVMSGLQAFALTASPDVIDKIREFTPIPSKVEEVPLVVPTDESIQDAPPLVIVETDSNAVTSPVSAVAPDYGRGLIDALGGFSDAAMMAASLSVRRYSSIVELGADTWFRSCRLRKRSKHTLRLLRRRNGILH